MFDGPECASYVQLCRELRLPRVYWQPGDLRWDPRANPAAWPGQVIVISDSESADAASIAGIREAVWLPRLDQWLTLLQGEGESSRLWLWGDRAGFIARFEEGQPVYSGEAPTREEACARLWMAVTGRTVMT